jgi:outer membrane protein TolC
LAQARATLPPLRKALAQQRDLLAALAGTFSNEGPRQPFQLADLHLPTDLPVSLPSQLIEQRPDIRAAQERLHGAECLRCVARLTERRRRAPGSPRLRTCRQNQLRPRAAAKQSGNAKVLLLLTGQTTYLQAVTQVVQARSARLADTAALFAALRACLLRVETAL